MIIERYILRNYAGPYLFAMSVITFVFIMDFIIRYIDLFLSKGVPFLVVLQVFALSLGHMFALIIPMAVLPATLMTYGTFAGENEITAMRACGFSIYRMIGPGFLAAFVLALGLVVYNNEVLPDANHRLMNLFSDINRKQPTVALHENRFIDDVQGYTIYFARKDDRTGEIHDVQIFKRSKKGLPTSIIARNGRLSYLDSENIFKVELYNGEIHELPGNKRDRGIYRKTRFGEYTLHIRDVERDLERTERTYRSDREMSVDDMQEKISQLKSDIAVANIRMVETASSRMHDTFRLLDRRVRHKRFGIVDTTSARRAAAGTIDNGMAGGPPTSVRQRRTPAASAGSAMEVPANARNEFIARQEIETQLNRQKSFLRQIDRYQVEIHKKYSIPFACIIFVMLGAPLAIRMGRSGMNMAIGLSILFFLVYYVCLIGGEKLADRGRISPLMSMWAPNILFGAIAAVMLRKAARETSHGMTLRGWLRQMFRRNVVPNPR